MWMLTASLLQTDLLLLSSKAVEGRAREGQGSGAVGNVYPYGFPP
jgi:hypothetical protein